MSTKLSETQVKALVDIRRSGYPCRDKRTFRSLVSRGLVVDSVGAACITEEAFQHLPEGIPHTVTPVVTYWLYSDAPERGAVHETMNGVVYRVLQVRDGVPYHGGLFARDLVQREHRDNWSWHQCGIIAKDKFEAEAVARKSLGDKFKGWVK